jgi:hypothetical protein
MTQEKLDFDLESLVTFLIAGGNKASDAARKKLAKASAATLAKRGRSFDITDADRREMMYFRQAGVLAATVEELKTWLDRLYHPNPLDYRRHVLFEFAASIAALARRCIDDDVADELLNREQKRLGAAHARTTGISAKVQPRNDLIIKLAKEIRLMSTVPLDKWQVAVKVLEDKRLTESKEWKAKPMKGKDNGRGGVYAIVKKNWSQLSPSLPPPKRTSRR